MSPDFIVQQPETVTWRVHLDRGLYIAGIRSLMLQALYPNVVRGVAQNSNFKEDPFGRLFRTAQFVAVRTLGSRQQADAAGAAVRDLHRRLRVHDTDTGRTRRIDEPEYLLWVHCAEVSSYLEVVTRAGLRLSGEEQDRYYREQRKSAVYVGLHESDVPGSRAEIADYFAATRPQLSLTPEAKETLRFLFMPTLPRRFRLLTPGRTLWFPIGALAYYSLPAWARGMYRALPEIPERAITAWLKAGRFGMRRIPQPMYDRMFSQETRDLVDDARRRLRENGYRMRRGLLNTAERSRVSIA